jgi:exodeoxyribonuclease V alpha subunit
LFYRAVVIAVTAVRVVQMPVHQVVDVIAVRDRLMAAARTVLVVTGMAAAVMGRSALGRVGCGDAQAMLLNPLGAHVVQVAVVQVVDVPVVPDGGMAAIGSVLVIMLGMMGIGHGETSSSGKGIRTANSWRTLLYCRPIEQPQIGKSKARPGPRFPRACVTYNDSMPEALSGTIEHVTFHNPDNGFAVLRVQTKGQRGLVCVVGHVPSVMVGEFVEATGSWVHDRNHGLQFQAQELRTLPPHTAEGIAKYLGSGLIKGIGPRFAKKIVDVFGERTLDVIDESPAFLKEVKGLGRRRIQLIRDSWQGQKSIRSIMVFLQSHGIGTARAVRIYKTYGDEAIDLIRANPYRLATDIWGIGFRTADELALKIGTDKDSPLRARAALRYVLQELSSNGHVGYPEDATLDKTVELTEIPRERVVAAAASELGERNLIRDPSQEEPWLYLRRHYEAETGVAEFLCRLCKGRHPLPEIKLDLALDWVQKKIDLELAPAQRHAVRQAATQKVLVITGGPGVGKTTIVRAILEIFAVKEMRCGLCAPTGRAAKRLAETTGQEARTIHRLLEFDPAGGGFNRDQDRPLDLDLLIVDEASMIDMVLMYQLLRALKSSTCLVLVGDVDQLPSVGPGTVLADIIASKAVPVVRLTEIFRQAEQSWIVRAAHRVHEGILPESAPAGQGDFFFIEAEEPDAVLERVLTLVQERIPRRFGFDPLRDIQVLTPMNRTPLGVRNLNQQLQTALNPVGPGPAIERFGWTFRTGDKVLQTVNDYQKDVFNGDIGRIKVIKEEEHTLTIDFDGRPVEYDFNDLDELALAYAMTIHKSQGSEYPAVVMPLHTQHYVMLQRNLFYTGITRGRKLVVVVGNRRALALAVRRQDTSRRFTALCRRLRAETFGC